MKVKMYRSMFECCLTNEVDQDSNYFTPFQTVPPSRDAKLGDTKNILFTFSLTSYQTLQRMH